jgi:hypothetical protein
MHETEPTPAAIEKIHIHLATRHGRGDFDLRRDVAYIDNCPAGALVTYLAETPIAPARFECAACPGRIFVAGDSTYGHPERNSLLLLAYPELGTTLLGGVGDAADRAMLLEDWDRGRLGQREVTAAHTRRSMDTKKADRPVVDERRERCQEFLLARVREGARVNDALAAVERLRTSNPPAYFTLMCGPTGRSLETLRKDWSAIPIAVRNAARANGARVRAASTQEASTP